MLFIDFFSGIGGFRLGMELAGHRCIGHCEKDKYAEKSYRAMHDVKEEEWFAEDITKVRAEELPRADVWCFGFPCQDISIGGNKEGFNGSRSSLFFAVTSIYSLRTLETYLVLTRGLTFSNFKLSWPKSAMIVNGNYLIQETSECPKTEKECTLLDILEEEVPEKYFLSQEVINRLVYQV